MQESVAQLQTIQIIAPTLWKREIGPGTSLNFVLTLHKVPNLVSPSVTHGVKRQQVSDALFSLPGYLRGLEGF